MSEIEDNEEWTKYKQARYFHKLARGNLIEIDDIPLLNQSNNSKTNSIQELNIVKASFKSSKAFSRLSYNLNAKKHNTIQFCYSPKESYRGDLDKRIEIKCEKTPFKKSVIKKKIPMTAITTHKTKIIRNNIFQPNRTCNVKVALFPGKSSLKNNVLSPKSINIEKKSIKPLTTTKKQLLNKTPTGKTLNLATSRSPNLSTKTFNKKISISKGVAQPKQAFKNRPSTKHSQTSTMVKINELV